MRFAALLVFVFVLIHSTANHAAANDPARPNILWISCEDISPNLGCYGDPYARTPNLDRLASQGTRFTRAFTHAGVCAVLRAGVITGMYPVSIGSHHMRSNIVPPAHVKCFTEYMRAVGYYCTNRSKTDYNFPPPATAWDQQGNKHNDWRGRAKGQPFFSVINITDTHESKIRHSEKAHERILAAIPEEHHHDPDKAGDTLPKYLPNTPAARKNWAWYHDNISYFDKQVGEILQRLEDDGLADNTVVMYWSDHGMGIPRGKRWIYDTGTLVPVIVRWPGKIKGGTERIDLMTMIDLTATTVALTGAEVPKHFHGRVLFGDKQQPEPKYLYFHRDRMDEALELMRSVRDRRFRYIRNFEPEKTYAQGIDYMDLMPAMQDWRRLFAEGKLEGGQKNWFAKPKPIEELYDTLNDPYELDNLASDPKHATRLATMRKAMEAWQVEVGDLGMLPEPVLMQRMRPGNKMETTAKPHVRHKGNATNKAINIKQFLDCPTKGASITYTIRGPGSDGKWKLYTGEPLEIRSGQTLVAKACRLGFKDSAEITYKANGD